MSGDENGGQLEENENDLGYKAIALCIILVFYIVVAHVIEKRKISFLHESSLSICIGLLFALIFDKTVGGKVYFDEKMFFNVILPPIILSAGYSLRKKYFIQNFGLIQFYGIVGTIIAFFVLSTFTIMFNEWNILGYKLQITDCLLLSAVFCATDTVAVLNLVKETEFPLLNSILFGEGIMNDAISIVIFRSIKNFLVEANQDFGSNTTLLILGDFLYLLFLSVLIGLVFGLGISYFFKKFDSFSQYPIQETALIYLISYMAYLFSEVFEFSGIISLFVCGVVLGQYTYHNISQESQKGTVLVFESIAYVAEAFVFCYLGMSVYNMEGDQIPYFFAFMMFLVICLARFFAIFTLPFIKFLCRRQQSLKMNELKVIWYSGLIRGAIAFAMVLQIKGENSQVLINTVLIVVVFTIVFLSSLLQTFSKFVGLQGTEEEEMIKKMCITDNQVRDFSEFGSIGGSRYDQNNNNNTRSNLNDSENYNSSDSNVYSSGGRIKQRIGQKLTSFEEKYIRPIFLKDKENFIQEIDMININLNSQNNNNGNY